MTPQVIADMLDDALQKRQAGEPVAAVLADYAAAPELAGLMETAVALETLQPVIFPSAQALQADRAAFHAQLTALRSRPVSSAPLARLNRWKAAIVGALSGLKAPWQTQRKERNPMTILLTRAALIITLLIGSLGGAAALSAGSLPGSPGYGVKIAAEQLRLALTSDQAVEAALYLQIAQKRAEEMTQIAQAGAMPDAALQTRLQEALQQALRLAAQLPDAQLRQALTQTRSISQAQARALAQAQQQASHPAQTALAQARYWFTYAAGEAQSGLQTPQTFRQRHAAGPPDDAPFGPNGDCYGGCEPAENQQQRGPQPQPPGGPRGDCAPNCEPVGDEHRYGPQPEPPGGPHGDCDGTGDCDPPGDQNQNQNQNQNGAPDDNAGGCQGADCGGGNPDPGPPTAEPPGNDDPGGGGHGHGDGGQPAPPGNGGSDNGGGSDDSGGNGNGGDNGGGNSGGNGGGGN